MILKRLRLHNFRSFAHADLSFGAEQNYVVGNNWQGKSSLVEAIAFALFGSDAFPRRLAGSAVKAEHLLNDGASSGWVELGFVVGDDEYTLNRRLPRTQVALHVNGKPLATGKKPVDEKLQDLLAVDAKFFANVFYADQDDLRKSFDLTPGERQLFIERLIGQEVWRERIEALRKAEKHLRAFIQDLASGRFGAFIEELDSLSLESVNAARELKDLNAQIVTLAKTAPMGIRELRAKKKGADGKIAKLQHQETKLEGEHGFLERLIEGLASGMCPTCAQAVPAKARKGRLAVLRKQLKDNSSKLREVQTALSQLDEDFEEEDYEGAEDALFEVHGLKERASALAREQARRVEREKRLRGQAKVFGKKPQQHQRAQAEVEFLDRLSAAIDMHRATLRERVVNELVVAMNNLLARFHDGDFDAEARIGSGMDLQVKLHGREVPLYNLSGAAKDLFAIALRYGLMRVAARKIDFLVLDEPTRHMDPTNIRQLRTVLDGLGDRQLVVVTVQAEFSDAKGQHFRVRKDSDLRSVVEEA
jgi:exonuclease SbcC